jgi:hypothetical protein
VLPSPVREQADRFAARQRALALAAVALLAEDPAAEEAIAEPAEWRDLVADRGPDLLALQMAAAAEADSYLTATLQAQRADAAAVGTVNAGGFADLTDGGGSWLRLLVFAPPSAYRDALDKRVGPVQAGIHGRLVATSAVLTGMQDTQRAAVQSGMHARRDIGGYVRHLRNPSCARCVLLAGRVYRSATPFRRHKRCDCVHVPMSEAAGSGWEVDPAAYFRQLSQADQVRVFGQAGAEAIRAGADISQVVNARAGIETVTAFGRELTITRTGTTRRALFGGYQIDADGTLRRRPDSELQRLPGSRYRTAIPPRLMPEQIFALAEEFGWSRDEVLAQLRRFAYIV